MNNILITGASRGLGLSLTEVYVDGGWRVFAGYRSPAPELDHLVEQAADRVVPVRIDVTSREAVLEARRLVSEHSESLDALVNNAAILPAAGRSSVATVDIDMGLEVFDTNALGPLRMSQAFLPLLRASERKLAFATSFV